MPYTLVGTVVHVYEMRFPVGGNSVVVYGESMVLRCYEATFRAAETHRLVMAAVSVFEFVDLRACGFAEELISHADSAYRLADLESLADILHCLFRKFGAAGTVADEKTVVGYLSEVIIPRHECDSHAAACQTADDIVFCAAVHKHYPLLPFSEFLDLSGADLGDEVFFVGVVKLYVLTPPRM